MADDPVEAARPFIDENRALWDHWAPINIASDFYDLDGFRRGGVRLKDFELEEIGDVTGLDLLHLQCHFGMDTLSWARLGAHVTGADFSRPAVEQARALAMEIGYPEARFVESDLYALPQVLDGEFDVVYTSAGVLGWLPDIRRWAQVVAHFVKPGGRFYLAEVHPIAEAFEDEGVAPGELRLRYPYWEHREPISYASGGSYAQPDPTDTTPGHGWSHGLGEIVTALIDAGLEIRALREHPFVLWPIAYCVEAPDGTYRLPESAGGELPLFFSILATKPAARGEP
jgi:SAM-dependent methyltransferase